MIRHSGCYAIVYNINYRRGAMSMYFWCQKYQKYRGSDSPDPKTASQGRRLYRCSLYTVDGFCFFTFCPFCVTALQGRTQRPWRAEIARKKRKLILAISTSQEQNVKKRNLSGIKLVLVFGTYLQRYAYAFSFPYACLKSLRQTEPICPALRPWYRFR